MLAIAIGAVAALGAAVAAAAVLTHGDETRAFGWTVVRDGAEITIPLSIAPQPWIDPGSTGV
jgi:hypothetical protein